MLKLFNLLPEKIRLIVAWLLDEVVVPFLPEKSKKNEDEGNEESL